MDRLPDDQPQQLKPFELKVKLQPVGCAHQGELVWNGQFAVCVVYQGEHPQDHISESHLMMPGDDLPETIKVVADRVLQKLARRWRPPEPPPAIGPTVTLDPV